MNRAWPLRGAWLLLLVTLAMLAGCASHRSVDRQQAASANADVGADYLQKDNNGKAWQYFEKALQYDKQNFRANWGMAVASERLGRTKDARRYFEQTLAIRPEPAVYNGYAAFLCEQGDVDQGVAYFQQALKSRNAHDRGASMANAGLCLYRAGRKKEAKKYFHRALQVDRQQPVALMSLAEMAYRAGDDSVAADYVNRTRADRVPTDQLLLAAKIELAANDEDAARTYLNRYNVARPMNKHSLKELETMRP